MQLSRRPAFVVPLLFGALTACTHHRPLREAHHLSSGDEVVAENHRGQTQPARVIRDAGGISLHSPIGVLPPEQVAKLTAKSHGQGAIEGLGIGALSGAGLGILIGLASGDDDCNDECLLEFSAKEKATIGAILLGGAGGLVGLVAGAMMGSTTIYSDDAGTVTVRAVAPAGSQAGLTVTF